MDRKTERRTRSANERLDRIDVLLDWCELRAADIVDQPSADLDLRTENSATAVWYLYGDGRGRRSRNVHSA